MNTDNQAALQPQPVNGTPPQTAIAAPKSSATPDEAAFALLQRRARLLASGTVAIPPDYQNNIPNVITAMELAERIGASVIAVMQHMHVIHGKPGWSASFLIATVNSCGRFTPLRFRFQGAEGTDEWGCRAYAKDRESGEECVGSLITIAVAKKEGWYGKRDSKWQTIPEQMLMYRAAAFWTRVYAPELSLGMQTVEEVRDVHGYDVGELPAAITPRSSKDLEAALMNTAPKTEEVKDAVVVPAEAPTEPAKPGTKKAKPIAKVDPTTGEVTEGEVDRGDDPNRY